MDDIALQIAELRAEVQASLEECQKFLQAYQQAQPVKRSLLNETYVEKRH